VAQSSPPQKRIPVGTSVMKGIGNPRACNALKPHLMRITLQYTFFHSSKFRNQISPPNVFLGKFQHLFPTLEHHYLPIYAVK